MPLFMARMLTSIHKYNSTGNSVSNTILLIYIILLMINVAI